MSKSNQSGVKNDRGKGSLPKQNPEALRRAHASLHHFADWLEQEVANAVERARARQLAPLRHALQSCRYLEQNLEQKYLRRESGSTIRPPSHFATSADLPCALNQVDPNALAACLDGLDDIAERLSSSEGRPFARKSIRVDARVNARARRQPSASGRRDTEDAALAELEQTAAKLMDVFRKAVAELAEAASSPARGAAMEHTVYTPPQLAKQLGVGVDKIYAWIRNGTLKAVDASKRRGGRPRFMISPEAVDEMMSLRSVEGAETSTKSPRKAGPSDGVIEFF